MFTFMTGCLTECAGATGTTDLTSLDLNDMLEKRSDTQNRTSVNGSTPKHGSTQCETSKPMFQSPKGTQEDYRTGLGIDHTDEGDNDKENLKRTDPSKLWWFISYHNSRNLQVKIFILIF